MRYVAVIDGSLNTFLLPSDKPYGVLIKMAGELNPRLLEQNRVELLTEAEYLEQQTKQVELEAQVDTELAEEEAKLTSEEKARVEWAASQESILTEEEKLFVNYSLIKAALVQCWVNPTKWRKGDVIAFAAASEYKTKKRK